MAKGRREIDKEAMFRKIMPSSYSSPTDEDPSPPAPMAVEAPPYTQPGTAVQQGPISIVGGGVQLRKAGSRILVNIMEYLVIDKLDEAYEKFNNCCKCDKCRQDAAALALNRLKPKYMVVEERKIPIYIAKNNTPEVTSAIVQSILWVKSHPKH